MTLLEERCSTALKDVQAREADARGFGRLPRRGAIYFR
jgi:hypothetical protein